jgi:hypothetical protein
MFPCFTKCFRRAVRVPRTVQRMVSRLALVGFLVAASSVVAQTGTQREYEIKAAVLFNVMKYVEWPAGSSPDHAAPLRIGLLGQIPFPQALTVLDGKTVQGRKVVVGPVSDTEAGSCHVLYVSSSEKGRYAEILSALRGKPVLTVSEIDGFVQRGGIVNLVAEGNRVGMEINRDSASQAGLNISSQLLRLAKVFPR